MKNVISISGSEERIAEIIKVTTELHFNYSNISEFAEFLLEIEENGIDVIILENSSLKIISIWLKIIKKNRPKIPVIIISEDKNSELIKEMYSLNIFYFCMPPISPKMFKQVLESAVKFHDKEISKNNLSFKQGEK